MVRILIILSFYIIASVSSSLFAETGNADLRLVITGDLKGAVRECACLYGQPGGLARRKNIFDQIRREMSEALFIEYGNLTNEQTNPLLLKDLFNKLKYDLICPYMIDYDRLQDDLGDSVNSQKLPFYFSNLKENNCDSFVSCNLSCIIRDVGFEKKPTTYSKNELLIISFTSLYNKAETDTTPKMYNYNLMDWDETIGRFRNTIKEFKGISVLICNWDYANLDMQTVPESIDIDLPGLDVIIIGGSGYVEPEVREECGVLSVYTGNYGEYIMVLDLWKNTSSGVSKYEWQAIPTEIAEPDSLFSKEIEKFYKLETKTIER
ncbi:hypothetical protein K9N50_00660 [bacterium]|nr:hypothetical protein [bacterium]